MPNPSLFPISGMQISLTTGATIDISGKLLNAALQYSASVSPPHFTLAIILTRIHC